MKLIKKDGEHFTFQVGLAEKRLLLDVLKQYPLVPPSHQRLSTSAVSAKGEDGQMLLEEALSEHKQEQKQRLKAFLDEIQFKENKSGYRLCLNRVQIEELLQSLNDVRVGNWLKLGCPDEKKGKSAKMTDETAHCFWTMEVCGYFQYVLIKAVGG